MEEEITQFVNKLIKHEHGKAMRDRADKLVDTGIDSFGIIRLFDRNFQIPSGRRRVQIVDFKGSRWSICLINNIAILFDRYLSIAFSNTAHSGGKTTLAIG